MKIIHPFVLLVLGSMLCLFSCSKDQINSSISPEFSTFVDPRDSTVYEIVKIGDQHWFAENLRYGLEITQVVDSANWASIWNNGDHTKQPAWTYYNNDPANDLVYGKLYNWYAVKTGLICPPGWHIPTDEEWSILINYLGGSSIAGSEMTSASSLWITSNESSTNSSGFSGLPGGLINYNADSEFIGYYGYWWSSTELNSSNAWLRSLTYIDNSNVYRHNRDKTNGYSCRCLKD